MNDKIVKPMPKAADHLPISVLNRTGQGIRTLIVCSCEWVPTDPGELLGSMTDEHTLHRLAKGLRPLRHYGGAVFGEGPWMGLTWDEWYKDHGGTEIDPYTGERSLWA